MNLLRIEQTYAKIGIESYGSKLEINSKLNKLNMSHTNIQIEINQELPKVLIDQHECFATAGLKNNAEIIDEAAQSAKQQVLEYTGKVAADGDMLADIKNKGNPIAQIALRDSQTQHEFDIDLIPKARPQIDVVGSLKIDFKEGKISADVEQGYVNINFTKPQINMYLSQKPSINIQYIGSNFDAKV